MWGPPWGNLRVPVGSSEDIPDNKEDSSNPRWKREGRYGKLL